MHGYRNLVRRADFALNEFHTSDCSGAGAQLDAGVLHDSHCGIQRAMTDGQEDAANGVRKHNVVVFKFHASNRSGAYPQPDAGALYVFYCAAWVPRRVGDKVGGSLESGAGNALESEVDDVRRVGCL